MTYTPAIGDYLTRPKKDIFRGIITHIGAVIGHNQVLQNTPEKGEHVATFEEFANGELVKAHKTGAHPAKVHANVQRILENPKSYHPVARNCEQTATEAVEGKPRSPQMAVIICCVAGFIIAIFVAVSFLKRSR